MKFPKQNPFTVPPACWQLRCTVPMEAALAVEDAFADVALSAASFESPEDEAFWQVSVMLDAPLPEEDIAARIKQVEQALGCVLPVPQLEPVEQQDWLAAVARDFPPVWIERFYVHGAHAKENIPPYALPLQVEAGTAFGSGEHATTRGCLRALTRLHKRRTFNRVLDMGCGSGILAIAAAKLWPKARVLGVDSDAVSAIVARENICINRVRANVQARHGDGYKNVAVKRAGAYDLILANILARPLVKLARPLRLHLAEGGIAVLSGLLDSQATMVEAAHRRQGLKLVARIRDTGWTTLIMEG